MTDKIDFKARNTARGKGGHFLMIINQEDVIILNLHILIIYKAKIKRNKEEIEKSTVIAIDVN